VAELRSHEYGYGRTIVSSGADVDAEVNVDGIAEGSEMGSKTVSKGGEESVSEGMD
jgi:hypothetical protein